MSLRTVVVLLPPAGSGCTGSTTTRIVSRRLPLSLGQVVPGSRVSRSYSASASSQAKPQPEKPQSTYTSPPPDPPPQTTANECFAPSRSSSQNKYVVGIIGGGITGLSTAYYLNHKFRGLVQPIVFEESGRVGGWVRTVHQQLDERRHGNPNTLEDGSLYEVGPRTIRPAGTSGMNTLDLVEALKLDDRVLYVEKNHPTAMNRLLYCNGKLVRLPSDASVLFRKQEPFSYPLLFAGIRDLVKRRERLEDDSIHNFVHRRFGLELADYIVDPLIRGVTGGDSKSISVKFLLNQLFELEQSHGSVIVGTLASRFKRKKPLVASNHYREEEVLKALTNRQMDGDGESDIGFSKIALASISGNWSVWTLEGGLETLPRTIEQNLVAAGVQIRKNTRVCGIEEMQDHGRRPDRVRVKFYTHGSNRSEDSITCDHVVSAVPAPVLGNIVRQCSNNKHETLTALLNSIVSESLQVTGLTYDDPYLLHQHQAFGFLVPSCEDGVRGLLGVVFDTNSFPQPGKTVITVMSRKESGGTERTISAHSIQEIREFVSKTMGLEVRESDHHVEVLNNCIPQYQVGHYEKVRDVRGYVERTGLPVTVAGASWDGVSINDCVFGGRKAATEVGRRLGINNKHASYDELKNKQQVG